MAKYNLKKWAKHTHRVYAEDGYSSTYNFKLVSNAESLRLKQSCQDREYSQGYLLTHQFSNGGRSTHKNSIFLSLFPSLQHVLLFTFSPNDSAKCASTWTLLMSLFRTTLPWQPCQDNLVFSPESLCFNFIHQGDPRTSVDTNSYFILETKGDFRRCLLVLLI